MESIGRVFGSAVTQSLLEFQMHHICTQKATFPSSHEMFEAPCTISVQGFLSNPDARMKIVSRKRNNNNNNNTTTTSSTSSSTNSLHYIFVNNRPALLPKGII